MAESWEIDVNGKKHVLPPNGYYMYGKGMAEGGSELIDGRRVDSLQGDSWLFANGAGKPVELAGIVCNGAYAFRWEKDNAELIALPEALEETVGIQLDKVPTRIGRKAEYIRRDGSILKTETLTEKNGKLLIPMTKEAYKVKVVL